MSSTRLTALLVAAGLGAAGLVPASASPAPRPPVVHLEPGRALHAAVRGLAPQEPAAAAWRSAYLDAATEGAAGTAEGRREFTGVYEVGDVDGDRRSDVAVLRETGTAVRSGRDGRALLRRDEGFLLGLTGTGKVRLLLVDVRYEDRADSYDVTVRLQGLDSRGRVVWQHEQTGAVNGYGIGPAYAVQLEAVPATFEADQRDAAGRPALLLGTLTGALTTGPAASRMDLSLLSLTDGTVSALSSVQGAGRGLPAARGVPPVQGARTCYVTTAPVGQVSRAELACDGGDPIWSSLVRLRDPYVDAAGDFDGDGRDDVQLTTFGFERPRPREVLRGTAVLSYADGSSLATSAIDGLSPLHADVDGDGQPDFLEFAFEEEGFAVQGVRLDGEVLYRSTLALRTSGSLEGRLGMDVTGDGVSDAFLRAQPEKGEALGVVVNGRTGRAQRSAGVDGLVWPGLRPTGIDLAVVTAEAGRLRTRVLSGDRGRQLLDVRVPGPAGTPAQGGAGTADLDADGRRDLVVASRSGGAWLTTAWSGTGRLLWQKSEKAPPVRARPEVEVELG